MLFCTCLQVKGSVANLFIQCQDWYIVRMTFWWVYNHLKVCKMIKTMLAAGFWYWSDFFLLQFSGVHPSPEVCSSCGFLITDVVNIHSFTYVYVCGVTRVKVKLFWMIRSCRLVGNRTTRPAFAVSSANRACRASLSLWTRTAGSTASATTTGACLITTMALLKSQKGETLLDGLNRWKLTPLSTSYFSFCELSVKLLCGFRVQAPRCDACRLPILPAEVSYIKKID